jgi:hypothetical protein
MRRLGLMVGFLIVASAAANAETCEGDSCKKLIVAAADEAGGTNPFDGVWSETITGESQACAGSLNVTFKIANGRLIQENSTGTISPNGSAHGTAAAGGFTATWTGHFSGGNASGRFKRNDGCIGRWVAVRQ